MGLDAIGEIGQRRLGYGDQVRRQIFLGEIDRGFKMGLSAQQLGSPLLIEPAQMSFQLGQSLPALSIGIGIDQIGDRLGLGQIHLAGFEGAAGEIARFGRAKPQLQQSGGDRLGNGAAAMQMQVPPHPRR